MKSRYFFLIIFFILIGFPNCKNRSAEEASKAKADSIASNDSLRKADSIKAMEAAQEQKIDINTKSPANRKFIKTAKVKFKVSNVLTATEKIEDLAAKYNGYLMNSNIQTNIENEEHNNFYKDSILNSKYIRITNKMQLRIPNENLDSFIRALNSLVLFLDYQAINLDDVTGLSMIQKKKVERLNTYTQRQQQHIDKKDIKPKETTAAEENLLNHQNQSDEIQNNNIELEDRIKYCDLDIDIYQIPIIVKEKSPNFEYYATPKEKFLVRIWNSILDGWFILEEILVFLFKLWGIAVIILTGFLVYIGLIQLNNKIKKKK